MNWAAIASAVHLYGLAIGSASIFARQRRLGGKLDVEGLTRMLNADNWWGIASILWIGSGLMRLLYLEKSRDFYWRNGFFWTKMSLFLVAMLLELWPMTMFIIWRVKLAKGELPDATKLAPIFRRTSQIQLFVIAMMVVAAALMARGTWLF